MYKENCLAYIFFKGGIIIKYYKNNSIYLHLNLHSLRSLCTLTITFKTTFTQNYIYVIYIKAITYPLRLKNQTPDTKASAYSRCMVILARSPVFTRLEVVFFVKFGLAFWKPKKKYLSQKQSSDINKIICR